MKATTYHFRVRRRNYSKKM